MWITIPQPCGEDLLKWKKSISVFSLELTRKCYALLLSHIRFLQMLWMISLIFCIVLHLFNFFWTLSHIYAEVSQLNHYQQLRRTWWRISSSFVCTCIIHACTTNTFLITLIKITYMLFAGWEVRIVKNCDRGLENAARGRRPRVAFSRPRSQFFTIRTDVSR